MGLGLLVATVCGSGSVEEELSRARGKTGGNKDIPCPALEAAAAAAAALAESVTGLVGEVGDLRAPSMDGLLILGVPSASSSFSTDFVSSFVVLLLLL
jgi:hypothetical protein